ncbi:MAG: formate dehydrogenase accessory protein FdhE [Actinobacteria bacterium]|nr:formate dehydrogenase accessory protein FdhE [Actinomycetota bacterium]
MRTRKERWVAIGDFGLKQRRISKSLVNRRAREYVENNTRLKGVTALYRGIFSVQRKLSQRIPDRLPHIEGAQISYRLQEGRLLLEAEEMEIDLALLKEMITEIIEVLRRKSKKGVEGLEDFLRGEKVDEVLRDMVDAFLERDEERLAGLMEDEAAEPALLYLLLHVSLAPFYWKAAGSLARRADLDQVARGTCPVCGDLPIMGYLRPEDGLRVLECSRCGTRWGFPRMMCPFCMSTDQAKLRYIYVEEDPAHRVYLCDGCGKYLKVTASFTGKEEELVIPLEDLATAHLDLAAEEKGYRRGCRTIFA